MKLAITGASGKLGRLTVEELLKRVPAQDVVVTTRTPDAVADLAQRGVEVRRADFDEPQSLPAAFAGVDRMIMISASNGTGRRDDEHGAAIRAAVEQGVQHIVFPSMPKVDDPRHPVGLAAQEYREAEETLAASGTAWTVLRDGPYAELHVVERFTPAVAAGRMVINTADGEAGFVSRRDVAAALAAVLTDAPGRHDGVIYDISGPELVSFRDVAEKLSRVSGREVEYVDVDDAAFAQATREAGVPALMVDALTGMGRAVREGYFAIRTDEVQRLTGAAPTSLDDVLEQHRDVLVAAAAHHA
jgi:NAD(P)H dehydrogenase (quinone)